MDHNTLMTASSLGLLDEAALQQQIMQKIREDVMRKPAYKISRLPNGRWQTYVRDGSGNRIQIKASSYDGIIDKLVLFKTNQDNPEYMTLDQLYQKGMPIGKKQFQTRTPSCGRNSIIKGISKGIHSSENVLSGCTDLILKHSAVPRSAARPCRAAGSDPVRVRSQGKHGQMQNPS